MKKALIWFFLCLLSIGIVGAIEGQGRPTPTPPPPPPFVEGTPPEGKALVYFMNDFTYIYKNLGNLVLSDMGPVGVLKGRRYQSYVAEPGNLKFYAIVDQGTAISCRLEAVSGAVYYIKLSGGFTLADLKLAPISRETAQKELRSYSENID